MGAYAIAGIEMALLDLKGKALGVPVAELLGGFTRDRVAVVGYLFIDSPEANAQKAGAFVDAGYTELKLKVGRDFGQDHDTIAAIRDRVGPDVKIRIDANMIWSVPAAIKWIRGLERFDLQYVEQPVPDFDLQGLAQVRRSVAVPIAADEACTDLRSVLELIKADACDVLRRLPVRGGRAAACPPDRRAGGRGRQVVHDRQLGGARRRDGGQRARRRRIVQLPVCQRHALSTPGARRHRRAVRDDGRPRRSAAFAGARRRARSGSRSTTFQLSSPRIRLL